MRFRCPFVLPFIHYIGFSLLFYFWRRSISRLAISVSGFLYYGSPHSFWMAFHFVGILMHDGVFYWLGGFVSLGWVTRWNDLNEENRPKWQPLSTFSPTARRRRHRFSGGQVIERDGTEACNASHMMGFFLCDI
ncbi:uncharacterized protein TRIVIDRAFT_215433 [Trichoderma virens Gv29-8]|uniref:Uncharacterized protein n=1 Tax=Hypocrea virens (strain Gv29-8 / FGSC 10586) TaxID=413071 RepID=G9MIW4_HYPVG|nr:uncharacterized protein TRIVIDRAFT_215433 [Trichoderma virens Gv29-8]EHK25430.1 hypothetical protein TRIVIDRAFT_215433 [Trichoderma virens Gv29-8]